MGVFSQPDMSWRLTHTVLVIEEGCLAPTMPLTVLAVHRLADQASVQAIQTDRGFPNCQSPCRWRYR